MADRLHLVVKHRQALEALLRTHLPSVEAWAYGSRVSERSQEGSDLDLIPRGPALKEIPSDTLVGFGDAVRDSIIPFPVKAHDCARPPATFRREIEREYVRFRSDA